MTKKYPTWCGRLLFYVAAALISMLTLFGVSFAHEKSGEIIQQLERKEIIPKETPRPIIEDKEDTLKEGKESEKDEKVKEGEKVKEVKESKEGEKVKEVKEVKKDEKKIFIRQINIRGATLPDRETIKNIIASVIFPAPVSGTSEKAHDETFFINKELAFSEMKKIVKAITEKYRKLGYILAYAYMPQQEITDGALEIMVKEGAVGEVAVTGNKSYSAPFIQKHIERIKNDPSPKGDSLERALLILNDYPSLNVKAQLKAGKEPGSTDITAQVKDNLPISGSLTYDNFGATTTSRHRLSAAFNIGNLAMSGDNLMLRGLTGLDRIDFDKLAYGRAEYLFPVNHNGTKIGVNYSNAVYKVGEEYEILEINGKADVAGVFITHPFIKKGDQSLEAKLGFIYEDVYDYMLGDIRSKDKIRLFTLGAVYDVADRLYGRNILNITYHHGVRYLFGGSGQNDPDTSRLNADGEFNKYTADATRVQKLPGYNHLLLRANGQYSCDSLFVAEQFMSGGAWSVRGFRPSALSGDSGYLLSAELHLSPIYPEKMIFNQKLAETIKLVLFVDNGGVYKNNIQPGEDKDDYQTSLGAGLRLYYKKNLSVKLDWAVPDREGAYNTKDAETYLITTLSF